MTQPSLVLFRVFFQFLTRKYYEHQSHTYDVLCAYDVAGTPKGEVDNKESFFLPKRTSIRRIHEKLQFLIAQTFTF